LDCVARHAGTPQSIQRACQQPLGDERIEARYHHGEAMSGSAQFAFQNIALRRRMRVREKCDSQAGDFGGKQTRAPFLFGGFSKDAMAAFANKSVEGIEIVGLNYQFSIKKASPKADFHTRAGRFKLRAATALAV